jgi:hypothetical protein
MPLGNLAVHAKFISPLAAPVFCFEGYSFIFNHVVGNSFSQALTGRTNPMAGGSVEAIHTIRFKQPGTRPD